MGLTVYRLMMIFSALRIMEMSRQNNNYNYGSFDATTGEIYETRHQYGEITQQLVCSDTDFENTLQMITVLVKHSNYVYTQIVQEKYVPKNKKELFLENLPAQFNRQGYLAAAISLGITDKSAQRYIKEFKDADIIYYDGHDNYKNSNAQNPQ